MTVIRTPLSAVINIEHALVSEQFGPLADELEHLSSTNLKALFVAYERYRGDSYWQPYLNALPAQTHTTLYFSEEELSQFQASLVRVFGVLRNERKREVVLPGISSSLFYKG